MPPSHDRVPLPGSRRAVRPGARRVGPVPDEDRLEVTVLVRAPVPSADELAARPPGASPLSRAELARAHGADPADLRRVEDFARAHGLTVVESSAPRASVVLAGDAGAMAAAFGVRLHRFQTAGGAAYRGREGEVHLPAELAGVVEGVLGLDDRPQARPHFRAFADAAGARGASYTPVEVARAYGFPRDLDGSGECIGILELGGGYRISDIGSYFAELDIAAPPVTAVEVDGARNEPGEADGPDGEVMLDIEVAGAVACAVHVVVYFAPNTDRGFLDALTTAVHDDRHRPSVISISWGGPEQAWTEQAMRAFDRALRTAAAAGITVCCASGDDGSSDGVDDGREHVDFPAASPHALACGGTTIETATGRLTREAAWNDGAHGGATGGGASTVFARPAYQRGPDVPGPSGRGVPDVAGDADPATGYRVRIDGQDRVLGGTSAVAPLWAGLVALLNQRLGRPVGFLNPLLYALDPAGGALRDVTEGDNGAFQAGAGWDACTGLGSPDGAKLLDALLALTPPANV